MSNVGKRWSKEEDEQLIDLYVNKEFTIQEIAKIHGRYTKGIATRLAGLKIIKDISEARGNNFYPQESYNNNIRSTLSSSPPINIPKESLTPNLGNDKSGSIPLMLNNPRKTLPECKECVCKDCKDYQNSIFELQKNIIHLQNQIIELNSKDTPRDGVLKFFGF